MRLRLVAVSMGRNRRIINLYAIIIVVRTGHTLMPMHYIRYDVLYAYVLSRNLQYWSGLVQHDEERLLSGC